MLLLSYTLLALAAATTHKSVPTYRDTAAPISSRVDDLVSRMTVPEKVAQLLHPWGASTPDELFATYGATGLGTMYLNWVSNETTPAAILSERNRLQKLFVEQSPFGIPISIVIETLHGGGLGGTLFPMPVNFAATFNLSLAAQAFRLIAADARARGAERAFSPVVNMWTDGRYGRVGEGFSEDPYVTTAFALAIVAAMQGDDSGSGSGPDSYMSRTNDTMLCTVKHFVGYGRGVGGIDGSPAILSPQLLNEIYLRPWKALADAGLLRSAMVGQNALNGVPMHAHAGLLGPNGTLRQTWGLARLLAESDGSDCIGALVDFRVAATPEDAAILSVTAGVDVDLGGVTLPLLVNASAAGRLPADALDRAVSDVLTAKFSSGLFDAPYSDPAALNPSTLDPPASRALAREAATQSIALLVNSNGTLPLAFAGKRVAVLGVCGNSTDALKGGYAQDDQVMVTVLDAFVTALGSSVTYAVGADPDATTANETRISEAVALAAESDVAVLVLGECVDAAFARALEPPLNPPPPPPRAHFPTAPSHRAEKCTTRRASL
jgi:beta-glucosidase